MFMKTEENPIEADVVIIDEMSMVDIILMYHLLKAIACGTRLILVGDVDQLPSVGPGNVLMDIIKSEMIKTVKLSEIFRQAGESMIVVNAHRINRGEFPVLNDREKDFFFVTRNSQIDILKTVVDLCIRRIPDTYGYDPMKQMQVLTPMRKGTAGVANLNIELQKVLNPEDRKKNQKVFRNYVFREGDRVMQIKNNYNLKWEKINDPTRRDGCVQR
ncbi:RecD-like DNA helicase YrrC [Acetivibrio straminisolvens JCM 21531]|uniref:RecD-like DNA helicase YrrC n=1 Tax=Acetivibrio straminisolvens JCM 21531 TaxID=1294263 RepID=W4V4M2_9FIRM|nr:RecD-like DNA helicase YrrC [Acetivibrio straminisolvens JCM 21531]